ncbi:MAG TPA: AMP-binding protein [Luteolibacter sp.]|nr:AMP-binding protein [Luteolibacter sp.]
MNLVSLLVRRAAEHPHLPALVDPSGGRERVVDFAALHQRVQAGAAQLEALGLGRDSVILVFQPVSIELYEILLAAFHRGMKVMLADPSAGREFLEHCAQRLTPDALFGPWQAHAYSLAIPRLRRLRRRIITRGWFPGATSWRTDRKESGSPFEVPDDHTALITFTSGSTGVPKAAVRSHGLLIAQYEALSRSLAMRTGEVDLITLPVFVLANLAAGMPSVLADTNLAKPGYPDAEAILVQCRKHRVTRCAASPAFFESLLRCSDGLPDFQQVYTGGAPVTPDLLARLQQRLPQARIESVYGSSEAEPIAHFAAADWTDALRRITRLGGGLCAGPAVPEIELKILTDHWGRPLGPLDDAGLDALESPRGQAGEIIVTGAHVLPGYLEGIGDGETKIRVAGRIWHRTGDAGWIDEAGRVWLLGRCAAKLPAHPAPAGLPADALSYPLAVECALKEEFPMLRCAALAWQGRRVLVVESKDNSNDLPAIRSAAVALGLAHCVTLEALPLDRRHNAKIDYPALKQQLTARAQALGLPPAKRDSSA